MNERDIALLQSIAQMGERIWRKDFYRKAGPPVTSLKRLAEAGLVEVETRSCSPWSFGPQQNMPWQQYYALPEEERKALQEADKKWHDENPRTLVSRSEVYAKITAMGIEEVRLLGG